MGAPEESAATLGSGASPIRRITSYNVCYTKLLRCIPSWTVAISRQAATASGELAAMARASFSVSSRSVSAGRTRLTSPIRRITSYNVCYTKLLRVFDRLQIVGA